MRRAGAAASAVIAAAGGACIVVAVSALPRPWTYGYVSEAGASDTANARWYHTGTALLGLALALLGFALTARVKQGVEQDRVGRGVAWLGGRRSDSGVAGPAAAPVRRWAAPWMLVAPPVLLIAAGVFAEASSRVSCTPGCPLPPYSHTTAQDLGHAGTSITAVGLTALAILAGALTWQPGPLWLIARVATIVCWPPLVALAVALLAIGRGTATAVLERFSLTALLVWTIVTAAVVACGTTPSDPARRGSG